MLLSEVVDLQGGLHDRKTDGVDKLLNDSSILDD